MTLIVLARAIAVVACYVCMAGITHGLTKEMKLSDQERGIAAAIWPIIWVYAAGCVIFHVGSEATSHIFKKKGE